MSDTISKIKLGGVTYTIDDLSKASIESVLEFGEITSENNSLLTFANSKLDELLNRISGSIKSQDFYKCASVGANNKTWTGYKAILVNGVYSFEDTVTEGLTYGEALTPVVDGIYNDGAFLQVSKLYRGNFIPEEGLVFHAPLQSNFDDVVGGAVADVTTGTFELCQGRPSMKAESGKYARWLPTNILPSGQSAMSLFVSFNRLGALTGWLGIASLGEGAAAMFGLNYANANAELYARIGTDWSVKKDGVKLYIPMEEWHTFALTRFDGVYYAYYDGELIDSKTYSFNSVTANYVYAGYGAASNFSGDGHFSDLMIYNRALSAEEVKAIHNTVMG